MKHNLFLSLYSFKIKRPHTSNTEIIDINSFLSKAYPDNEISNKFENGFVQDIINLIDQKTYKNRKGTHGGILDQKSISKTKRTFDAIIDGGTTGISQFIINESGGKKLISSDEIVGPKFFIRFWMPAASDAGYVFIQKYGSFSIKPLVDDIIFEVFHSNGFTLVGNSIVATTTKKRLKEFYEKSTIKDVMIISNRPDNSTGGLSTNRATIKLKGISTGASNKLTMDYIKDNLKKLGIQLLWKDYGVKATYIHQNDDFKEERTASVLENQDETINIVPSILVPHDCVDSENYPIFTKMQHLCNVELKQIEKER